MQESIALDKNSRHYISCNMVYLPRFAPKKFTSMSNLGENDLIILLLRFLSVGFAGWMRESVLPAEDVKQVICGYLASMPNNYVLRNRLYTFMVLAMIITINLLTRLCSGIAWA